MWDHEGFNTTSLVLNRVKREWRQRVVTQGNKPNEVQGDRVIHVEKDRCKITLYGIFIKIGGVTSNRHTGTRSMN